MGTSFHSGFVALIGRPNVGKSTLLNAALGERVAICSPVAQTTRKRLRGVVTTKDTQLIIVDTPGIHKPQDALGKELNKAALSQLHDVDVIAFLIDATAPVGTGDAWIAKHINTVSIPKVLVLTKADAVQPEQLSTQITKAQELGSFNDVVVVSAQENFNVNGFINAVTQYLPEGPQWFDPQYSSDVRDEELIAEFIREKVLLNTREEIPHSVGVFCDEFVFKKNNSAYIRATIVVERSGQKGILIGANAGMIKKIGSESRKELERLFNCKIFLDLQVRVQKMWRKDQNEIKRLGYRAMDD